MAEFVSVNEQKEIGIPLARIWQPTKGSAYCHVARLATAVIACRPSVTTQRIMSRGGAGQVAAAPRGRPTAANVAWAAQAPSSRAPPVPDGRSPPRPRRLRSPVKQVAPRGGGARPG